jgi:hypothetical protein
LPTGDVVDADAGAIGGDALIAVVPVNASPVFPITGVGISGQNTQIGQIPLLIPLPHLPTYLLLIVVPTRLVSKQQIHAYKLVRVGLCERCETISTLKQSILSIFYKRSNETDPKNLDLG